MLEKIVYTGPAWLVDEEGNLADVIPISISGTFDVIDVHTNERGTEVYVADKDDKEYLIDAWNLYGEDIDLDHALGEEE